MQEKKCLHVMHLLEELQYSGAEKMLRDAQRFFEQSGIRTTVLSTGEELGPYAETLKKCGYTIEHIRFRKSISYFWRLYRFIKAKQFDVIHIHPERAYFYHALIARLAMRAVVRTVHDVFFQYSECKTRIRKIQRYIAREWLSIQGLSISDSVHALELNKFSNPTEIVYNWINDKAFRVPLDEERHQARTEFHLSEDNFVLCTVGTCNEKKRHKDIFDAIARVNQQIHSIVLLHVGIGPDTEEEYEYVRKLSIKKNVRFLGYVDFMPKVYWASDCLIFSSKWEGLGNVIIEAIACALPVIMYEGWGMNDFKPEHDEMFGYWLNPETESLDSAILDIFENKKRLIPKFQANARQFFTSKFSREKSLKKLVHIYRGSFSFN